jgi:hypothetical protein
MTDKTPDTSEPPAAAPSPVITLKYHTLNGEEHQVDDKYAAPADQVSSLVAQGLVRVLTEADRGERPSHQPERPPHATQLPAEPERQDPDPKRRR